MKCFIHSSGTIICALVLGITLFLPITSAASEPEEIIWPYFPFRPWFTVEEDHLSGAGIELQRLFASTMQGYKHLQTAMPPARMFENLKQGANLCVVGAMKTPEREAYAAYSLPCRIALNDVVIIHKSDFESMESQPEISLEYLLQRQDLNWGITHGVSYGAVIDEILSDYTFHPGKHAQHGDHAMQRTVQMVLEGRIDWTIGLPMEFVPALSAIGTEELVMLPISELEHLGEAGHVACPDNDWGRKVIKDINMAIRQAVESGELLTILERYAPAGLEDKFLHEYERLIRSRIQSYPKERE